MFVVFLFGTADRIDLFFGLSYSGQLWVYRVLVWVLPVAAGVAAYRLCGALREKERIEHAKHEAEEEAKKAKAPEPAVHPSR